MADKLTHSHRNSTIRGIFPETVSIKAGTQTLNGKFSKELSTVEPGKIDLGKIKEVIANDAVLLNDFNSLTYTAVHPDIETSFQNPLIRSTAYSNIPQTKIDDLRKRRGAYTYIDQEHIPHHPHIGNHVLAVAATAKSICELLRLNSAVTKACVSKALLHDGSKIAELLVERMQELRLDAFKFGLTPGKETEEILFQANVPPAQIQKLKDAAGLTGHLSLDKFLFINEAGALCLIPGRLIEKIIHVADDMVSETSFMPVNDRMLISNFEKKYPYLWDKGMAICSSRTGPNTYRIKEVDAVSYDLERLPLIGSYADLQIMTTQAISSVFLKMINHPVGPNPNAELCNLLKGNIH